MILLNLRFYKVLYQVCYIIVSNFGSIQNYFFSSFSPPHIVLKSAKFMSSNFVRQSPLTTTAAILLFYTLNKEGEKILFLADDSV